MQNPDIARVFDEVADLLEIQDANPFRVRAYRNAAPAIRDFPEPIGERVRSGAKDLTDIPGIGEDLAEKITAIVTTGELPLRRQLAAKLPAGLLDLLRIPGLGPKRVKLLYKKLKVKSAADLAKVLDAGKRSEEHTSELQSRVDLVCRLLLEKKKHGLAETSAPPALRWQCHGCGPLCL